MHNIAFPQHVASCRAAMGQPTAALSLLAREGNQAAFVTWVRHGYLFVWPMTTIDGYACGYLPRLPWVLVDIDTYGRQT